MAQFNDDNQIAPPPTPYAVEQPNLGLRNGVFIRKWYCFARGCVYPAVLKLSDCEHVFCLLHGGEIYFRSLVRQHYMPATGVEPPHQCPKCGTESGSFELDRVQDDTVMVVVPPARD